MSISSRTASVADAEWIGRHLDSQRVIAYIHGLFLTLGGLEMFKLAERRGGRDGLYCGRDGVYLGSAALIERRGGCYWLRAENEVAALLAAAQETPPDVARFLAGLHRVGAALAKNDLGQAMIAAVHLRVDTMSELNEARVVRIDRLTKYNFNPLEPRDWHGRWTGDGMDDTASPAPGDVISAPRLDSCDDASEQSARLRVSARTVSGVASWYNLVGHRMANGKIFDPNAMNAAMLKVPLGTVVRVHLADDPSRNVSVTITDRGPYKAGRVIDLTPTAFQALTGTLNTGLASVVITVPSSK